MQRILLLSFPPLLLVGGCAAPAARYAAVESVRELSLDGLADELQGNDVVFLGEIHDNVEGHRAHRALIGALYERRPEMTLSFEMFERDQALDVWQYLQGILTASELEAGMGEQRWPNFRRDYLPMLRFAKEHELPVLAANVPRPLAAKVAAEGLGAIEGNPHAAREVEAPKDAYWEKFAGELEGLDEEELERFYLAQCLKDATMAESIADHLRHRWQEGARPLVVHVTGRFHVDGGLGTVSRLERRLPGARVAVVTMVERAGGATLAFDEAPAGDYAVVVAPPEQERPDLDSAAVHGGGKEEDPHAMPHDVPAHGEAGGEEGSPALGFRPDYEYQEGDGLRILEVGPDSNAAKAGLEDGDLILQIGAMPVYGMPSYMAVLGTLKVGETVEVLVERDGEEKTIDVVVGTR